MNKPRRSKRKASAGDIVSNVAAATPAAITNLLHISINARTSMVRNDKMEGRDFIVVPMVMMVEGVHSGSQGALFYPADELGKTPQVWNGKPIVVYHPEINGNGVSACSPEIFTSHKIGVIMNTKFDKLGRLVAEAWIEEARANAVDTRIMEAINNKQTLELSTGLFTDNDETPGEWEGEKYDSIARNYRPDHLAVLPDQIGACSIADGAGFIRNQASRLILNYAAPKDPKTLQQARDVIFANLSALQLLEASHETIRSRIGALLAKKYPPGTGAVPCYGPWVEAVYEDFFVYEKDGKLFKLGYSATDTEVKLEGEPSEVVRVTEYRTVSGAFVGNDASHQPKKTTMNKTQKIDTLVGNKMSGFTEADRPYLTGLDEARLDAFIANANKTAAPATTEAAKPAAVAPAANVEAAPAAKTEAAKPAEPALNKEQAEALEYGQRRLKADKSRLVKVITGNKANKFTEAQLNGKSIEELESIAALCGNAEAPEGSVARYDGLGSVADQPVGNKGGDEEPLLIPSMSFEPASK